MSDLGTRPLHVCECGQPNEPAADRIAALEQQVRLLQENEANLTAELVSKLARIKRMKRDQDEQRRSHPKYADAMRVLGHWQAHVYPQAKELSGKRLDNVLARLAHYSVEQCCRACDGYALKPYVVSGRRTHQGPRDSWYADAELIFREAKKVDEGIRIAEQADHLRQAMTSGNGKASVPEVSVGRGTPRPVSPTPLSALGSAALRAARHGWQVFPCLERDKAPATARGLLNAQTNEQHIIAWWLRHPACNVAVRTGAPSDIVVLDLDGDDGWDSKHALEDEHAAFPETLSVETPRGGHHFYFQHPRVEVRNTTGYPKPALDIRGDGGYVLMPPSVGANGRAYSKDDEAAVAPMPDWLVTLLVERQNREDQLLAGHNYVEMIDGMPSGERNSGFARLTGHWLRHNVPPTEVLSLCLAVNAQCKPPLPPREVEAVVKSILRRRART